MIFASMKTFWLKLAKMWHNLLIWAGVRKLSFREKLPPAAKEQYDQIVKLLKPQGVQRTDVQVETIPKGFTEMTPSRANLWMIELGDIESFLVAEFNPPSIFKLSADEPLQYGSVFLSFYDVIGGSMVSRLSSLLKNGTTELVVKIIDPVGTVIEAWKMKIRPASVHPLTILDYTKSDPIRWQLEADCLDWEVFS